MFVPYCRIWNTDYKYKDSVLQTVLYCRTWIIAIRRLEEHQREQKSVKVHKKYYFVKDFKIQNVDGNQVNLHLQICMHNLQQCPFKLYLGNKEKPFRHFSFQKSVEI